MNDRHYIGGGNIAGILGISPFRTPFDEYETISGLAEAPSAEKLKFFKRRKSFEPVAAEIFESETGMPILCMNHRYQHPDFDFIKAEIDAETADGNVEIKTVHPMAAKDWGESWSDDYPEYVAAQALHGLAVTGRQTAYVMAMIGFDDVRIYTIERDEDSCDGIIDIAKAFWRDHILPGVPPDPRSTADLLRRWPRDDGQQVVASVEVEDDCKRLSFLRSQMNAFATEKDELEQRVKLAIGPASELARPDGTRLATWKSSAQRRVDVKALRNENPELADRFTKTQDIRRFLLK